jgi:ABC-type multidrug transport system fused ATPase/permease subunit
VASAPGKYAVSIRPHILLWWQDELLLLKRGGQVVFQGDLGKDCSRLVNYFENLGATKIELGENPANWMLRVITSEDMGDLAQKYVESKEYALLCKDLDEIKAVQDPELKIEYKDEFAASKAVRQLLVNGRLRLIYWRSPAYNLSRLMVSMVIAFVLGSVFILVRHPEIYTEVEMRSRLSVIFLTFIITGIMAILSVIPVMTKIREMFYRHRDSGMYDSAAIGWALGSAEKLFIVLATTIFTVVFLSVAGMTKSLRGLFGFWVRLPKVTCYQGLENELVTPHIVSCFLLVGILHVQLCDILLLWTGFRLFG